MMSIIYRFIQDAVYFFLAKKHPYKVVSNFLAKNNYDEIHDIGGADGELLNFINMNNKKKYICYDVNNYLLQKGRDKFKNKKNIIFKKKGIDQIKIENNNKKKIFILLGVFHHIEDKKIKIFLKKIKKNHIIAFEPYYDIKLGYINFFISKIDRGNYVRNFLEYKLLFKNFKMLDKANCYVKFISTVLIFKNIESKVIKKYF